MPLSVGMSNSLQMLKLKADLKRVNSMKPECMADLWIHLMFKNNILQEMHNLQNKSRGYLH